MSTSHGTRKPVVGRLTTQHLPSAMAYAREAAAIGWFVTIRTSADDFVVVVTF